MARGRCDVAWSMVTSIVRIVSLSMSGKEPPLEAFIPNTFLPEEMQRRELTKADIEKAEEYKRKKADLDIRIMTQLAREGKLKRRPNGTAR